MRFEDEIDDDRSGLPVIYMALGVSAFIFIVLMLVISLNKKNSSSGSNKYKDNTPVAYISQDVTPSISSSTLVASDLDFWDMYPVNPKDEEDINDNVSPTVIPTISPTSDVVENLDDGEHVKVTYKDGSEEWVKIDSKLEKNNYEFTNLVDSGGLYKYVKDGKTLSFCGIDISRYQKEIDFERIKAQGIEFVMIRVGARGYKNGALSVDEYFEENIKKATDAGLDVGVYFYSQAITETEAVEEAQLVIDSLNGKTIRYPVAFDMEFVDNDTSRIDTLTKEERTNIAAAFVNKIKEAGYKPMIYGDKEWLIKRIDIGRFTESSFWLSLQDKEPDYPYCYDIWQYSTDGSLYGIDGPVDLDICFVDYAAQ